MEQTTETKKPVRRSKEWEQIYSIVETLPRCNCNGVEGMDAPDLISITTELDNLLSTMGSLRYNAGFDDGIHWNEGRL